MFTLPRLAAVSALTLALASNARAQAPSTYAPPARPSSPPAAAPALPEPPVNFVATFGADFGSTKLIEATMSDGSSKSLKANQGVNGSVGLAFLKLDGGRFATQATIGVEYSAINASNGGVRWLAFPLEIMEMAYLDPIRLGAGLTYLLSPSLKGDGFFAGLDIPLKNSAGLVLQADWVFRLKASPRSAKATVGARYVIQSLKADLPGAQSVDANAFGIVLGFVG